METMGQRIKQLRENRGLNQTQLSEIVGAKTYTTVSKWESDSNVPKGKDLKVLAEFFNVTSDYILGLDEQRPLMKVYNELDSGRKHEVYQFAQFKLQEQNSKVVSMPDTLAAHSDNINEELTPEKLQHNVDVTDEEIEKYIAKQKKDK